MTNRELVSSVRAEHKLLTSDALISDRVILSEGKRISRKLIKQQTDKRRLWQTDSIFTTIPCLEMEEVSLSQCCAYNDREETISRSKYKLPKIGEGIFQYLIKSVSSVNGKYRIYEITAERYINLLKLRRKKEGTFFWIENGWLYITSPEIKAVKVIMYFEDDNIDSRILHPTCEECKNIDVLDCLPNPYDEQFKAPGFLEADIVNLTSQKLLSTYHKLQKDTNSDDEDTQVNKK